MFLLIVSHVKYSDLFFVICQDFTENNQEFNIGDGDATLALYPRHYFIRVQNISVEMRFNKRTRVYQAVYPTGFTGFEANRVEYEPNIVEFSAYLQLTERLINIHECEEETIWTRLRYNLASNQLFVRQILNSYTEECGFKYDSETEDWVELKERRDLPSRTWEGVGLNGDRFLFSV